MITEEMRQQLIDGLNTVDPEVISALMRKVEASTNDDLDAILGLIAKENLTFAQVLVINWTGLNGFTTVGTRQLKDFVFASSLAMHRLAQLKKG